ncbi:MAG: transcriptional regulator [Alphaproteobacteria bacterium]|nr:MAG: transcriptional regulator [Alphaproteobacteria bacterium]
MNEECFLKIGDVTKMTTLSATEIRRRIAKSSFPKPYALGACRKVWSLKEVQSWIFDVMSKKAANDN